MGGHAGGQYASTLTVENIARSVLKRIVDAEVSARESQVPVQMTELIDVTIRETCAAVYDRAMVMPELRGMGSTVTAMMAYGEMAWIGHVGDSRAYLIRDGNIHQITEDHSLVQEQVAAGLITAEQAKHSMIRNIITRSIGFERDVRVDTAAVPLKRGDQFVLCSDGLTGHVEDHEILDIVSTHSRANAPTRLIDLANQRGGEDNSTVVLASVLSRRNTTRGNKRRVRSS
jgi:protein phosphatase